MHTWPLVSLLTPDSEKLFVAWHCLEVWEILLEKEVLAESLEAEAKVTSVLRGLRPPA